ncbi:hypothetical protein ACVI1J_005364 [Bradyrhizobium diazoefficiens]
MYERACCLESAKRIASITTWKPQSSGISFANAHQTVDSSGHAVTEYIRHSLSREGKLTVRASKLVVGTTELANQGEFICEVPDGAKFIW